MRVLHLVEPWSGIDPISSVTGGGCDSLLAACSLACRDTSHDHHVCLLGPSIVEPRARAIGITAVHRIAPPLGRPELAWRSVARLARATGPFDLIVCWGERVGRLARRLRGANRSVVTATLSINPIDPKPATLLHLSSPSPTLQWAAPWQSAADIDDARARSRTALGTADNDVVITMLDDPAHGANARRFIFLLATLNVAGYTVVGLMPTGSREQPRARRFHHRVCPRTRIITLDRPTHAVLPACDIAVLFGRPEGAVPQLEGAEPGVAAFNLSLAAAAGVPTISAALPTLLPFIPEPSRRSLAHSSHTTDMGRAMYPLVIDTAYRRAVRDALLGRSTSLPPSPRVEPTRFAARMPAETR